MNITEPRNILLTDITLNWAKLAKPITNQFGATQFELQAVVADQASADAITAKTGLKSKEKDGVIFFNLKRKAFVGKESTPNSPVRVVDAAKNPIDGSSIGNGSVGDVVIWQAPYEFNGVKGVTTSLTAVMVKTLVEYKPSGSDPLDMFSSEAPSVEATQSDMF